MTVMSIRAHVSEPCPVAGWQGYSNVNVSTWYSCTCVILPCRPGRSLPTVWQSYSPGERPAGTDASIDGCNPFEFDTRDGKSLTDQLSILPMLPSQTDGHVFHMRFCWSS